MEIAVIDPSHHPQWDEFIHLSPRGTFFHSAEWCSVLQKSYGYHPCYFSVWEKGRITAAIPLMEVTSFLTGKRAVSLPFTDYCDPIAPHSEVSKVIFDSIKAEGKKRNWKYVELRGGKDYLGDRAASAFFYRHTLDLSVDADKLFKNLRDSTRRNIMKAEKEGIEISFETSLDALRAFYRLNCLTRREHGLPPQPWHFFIKLHEEIIEKGKGFVAIASFGGAQVAANIYLYSNGVAIYKYGASDKAYQHLRANNLIMWEAIKWFARNGYRQLCFGRTERENEGLRQFKSGWGANESMIKYYRYNLATDAYIPAEQRISSAANRLFSSMPILFSRAIGAMLYRHVG
jgi:hypothetical protein